MKKGIILSLLPLAILVGCKGGSTPKSEEIIKQLSSKVGNINSQGIGYSSFTFTSDDTRLHTNNLTAVAQIVKDNENIILSEKCYVEVKDKYITSYVFYDASDVKYNESINFDLIFNFSNGESSFVERKNNYSIQYTNIIGDSSLDYEGYCFTQCTDRNISLNLINNDPAKIKSVDDIKVSIQQANANISLDTTKMTKSMSDNNITLKIPYNSQSATEGDKLNYSINVEIGDIEYKFDGLSLTALDAVVPINKIITTTTTSNNTLLLNLADDSDENTYKVYLNDSDRNKLDTVVNFGCGDVVKNGNTLSVPIILRDDYVSYRTELNYSIKVICSGKQSYEKIISGLKFNYKGPSYKQDKDNLIKKINVSVPNTKTKISYKFTFNEVITNANYTVQAEIRNKKYMNWFNYEKYDVEINGFELTITFTFPEISAEDYLALKGHEGNCSIYIEFADTKNNIKLLTKKYTILCTYITY